IIKNAAALADALLEQGFKLVSGGTDNHLMLVDLRPFDVTGKQLENWLDEVNITCNKNAIPDDPQKPMITSGVRLGTPAVTTRGLKEEDMKVVAECITLIAKDFEGNKEAVKAKVLALCEKYPLYN
ncbi:MAG: serine hydroxymethyltransferase, partial [Oscillospiraceae bacterium]|nr:serine hydroxymethyltransferase [Oscillospiraceae bacterium]